MYFTINKKVGYCECDCTNRMKLSGVLQAMQQTSSEQMEALDISPEKLYREGMVFLLSKINLKVHRMPRCSEEIKVGTAALQPKGPRFFREFVVDSAFGERLISALTLWILVVPESRKILRPNAFPYDLTFQAPALSKEIGALALPKWQESGALCQSLPIRYSHIDVNGHVNNSMYADFICDALPYETLTQSSIDTLVLHFQNEARLGDMLDIFVAPQPDGTHLRGLHANTACFEAFLCFAQQSTKKDPAIFLA